MKYVFCVCFFPNVAFSLWWRRGKGFCECPFALHCKQPERISKMVTLLPPEKFYADVHADMYFTENVS